MNATLRRSALTVALAASMATASLTTLPLPAHAGDVTRYGGEDRVATAITIFQDNPTVFTSDTVIITRSDAYADALTATPLAAALKAPVLTTGPGGLDPRVLEALKKSGTIKNVIVIGGPSAVSREAEEALAGSFSTSRIAGNSRYETAVKIAEKVMEVKGTDSVPVFLATGTNFPDALAAGAAAAAKGAVVLLSQGASLSPEAAAFISSPRASSTTAVGGPAGQAMNSAGVAGQIITGKDRYETAAKLAAQVYPNPSSVVIASGETYADSLAGAALAALTGAPMVLTGTGALPSATRAYISRTDPEVSVLGGPSAIPDAVAIQIAVTVGGTVRDSSDPRPTPSPSPTPTTPPTPGPPAPTVVPQPMPTAPPTGAPTPPVIDVPAPPVTEVTPPSETEPTPPSELAWTKDLPESLSVWAGDSFTLVPEANWDRDVQFQTWIKWPDTQTFTAWSPSTWSGFGFGDLTEHQNGTQFYVTAAWNGQTIRSETTTLRVLTAETAPDAKNAGLALETPADVTTDAAVPPVSLSATTESATEADGTVEFWVSYKDDGRWVFTGQYADERWKDSQVWAPVPGEYSVVAVFRPEDPYAHRFVKTEAKTFTVAEDPNGRLKDIAVTADEVLETVSSKDVSLTAQVRRDGTAVTTGVVEFYAGRGLLCRDTDGTDGWSCKTHLNNWHDGKALRAKYLTEGEYYWMRASTAAARFSSPQTLTVRDFTLSLSDGETTSLNADPIVAGASGDSVPLTRGGKPLTVEASDDVELGEVEHVATPSSWSNTHDVTPKAPVVSVDGDDRRVEVHAPEGTTPGLWWVHGSVRTKNEMGSGSFTLLVEILSTDGVLDLRGQAPGQGRDDKGSSVLYLPSVAGVTWDVNGAVYRPGDLLRQNPPWTGDVTVWASPTVKQNRIEGPVEWRVVEHTASGGRYAYTNSPEVVAAEDGTRRLSLPRPHGWAWKIGDAQYGPSHSQPWPLTIDIPADGMVRAVPEEDFVLSGATAWHFTDMQLP